MAEDRVFVSRTIAAPASAIFAIVTDPAAHVKIDGSHMLVTAPDAKPVAAVGDYFMMDMDRDALGDFPLGEYTVKNTITKFEPDRLLEWNVGSGEPLGHVYGYELEPDGDTSTTVTLYCDWSGISDATREFLPHWPIVPKMALITTLEKLDQLATS